jgi:hypothetical protein
VPALARVSPSKLGYPESGQVPLGADLAETISRVINAENAHNATVAAAPRFSQTSFFDYLKNLLLGTTGN